MNAPVTYNTDSMTPLRCRKPGGGTAEMTDWYLKSETGPLLDVLLGPIDSFRWLGEDNAEFSSLVRESLRKGRVYEPDLARRQHAEQDEQEDVLRHHPDGDAVDALVGHVEVVDQAQPAGAAVFQRAGGIGPEQGEKDEKDANDR